MSGVTVYGYDGKLLAEDMQPGGQLYDAAMAAQETQTVPTVHAAHALTRALMRGLAEVIDSWTPRRG